MVVLISTCSLRPLRELCAKIPLSRPQPLLLHTPSCHFDAVLPEEGFAVEDQGRNAPMPRDRSEEHTSELQSLMRISYAVFCLKKKPSITTLEQHMRKKQ